MASYRAAALLALIGGAAAVFASDVSVTVGSSAAHYEVRGRFSTGAPVSTVWEVLTDYGRIGTFVSSIQHSSVERRAGDTLEVRQVASIGAFLFRRTARVTLSVTEEPMLRIGFVDVLGRDFRSYSGSWSVRADSGATVVQYALDVAPRAGVPGWLGRGMMSRSATDLLSQVRAEIERRAAKR